MLIHHRGAPGGLALLVATLLLAGCAGEGSAPPAPTSGHPLLGDRAEAAIGAPVVLESPELAARIASLASAASGAGAELVIDYPLDETVFPPEFVSPTFLWHDPDSASDTWLIEFDFGGPPSESIAVLVPGAPRPKGEEDLRAYGDTNEPYLGTEYQNSAISWTPTAALWEEIKQRSSETQAAVSVSGWASGSLDAPRSRGTVRILTSSHPVEAPIFYRDVPLRPDRGENGVIRPLAKDSIGLINWRLRDISKPESKVVLTGMRSCANCHSFSLDGKKLGMDVDGPTGDKGMYTIADVSKEMVIKRDDVITWNSFPDKPEGHKTIGFLSRISPDGRFVVSTVNEELFVANYTDYRFLQTFYPTRGILAFWSEETGKLRALPGADDPAYVHCNPAWSPDGKTLIFARAPAMDAYPEGHVMPTHSNDPNELQLRFDLYRMPFNEGRGGTPEPVKGASDNGMSNTFPKVSPDGKWIVYVKCRNGQLMRPDGRLVILPFEGGEAREMRCNTDRMNSWHSFSPNSRWMVFSSKTNTPYTQAFLTHLDEDGNDSPAVLIPNSTAVNRAVNLPEFVNIPYESLNSIRVPAVDHIKLFTEAMELKAENDFAGAVAKLVEAVGEDPEYLKARRELGYGLLKLGQPAEAAPQLEAALDMDPKDEFALNHLANAYLKMGQVQRAISLYTRLIEADPENRLLDVDMHTAQGVLTRIKESAAEALLSLKQKPDDAVLLQELSVLSEAMGDTAAAVAHLRRAVEQLPDDPSPMTRLAWLLATDPREAVRDGAEAVRLAERAVELTESRAALPLDVLAAACAEAGRFEEAIQAAEHAEKLAKKESATFAVQVGDRLRRYRAGRPYRSGVDF